MAAARRFPPWAGGLRAALLLKGQITMRIRRTAARRAGALAAPLLLADTLGGLGSVPAHAATAGCQGWTGLQPPSPGTGTLLNGARA